MMSSFILSGRHSGIGGEFVAVGFACTKKSVFPKAQKERKEEERVVLHSDTASHSANCFVATGITQDISLSSSGSLL